MKQWKRRLPFANTCISSGDSPVWKMYTQPNPTPDLLQKSYSHLNTPVEQYDRTLLSIRDNHAPKIQRQITVRPSVPWYTQEVADERNKRRRLERKWRESKLQSDCERYMHQCYVVNNLICNLKTIYYREIISENSGNQKVLFNT